MAKRKQMGRRMAFIEDREADFAGPDGPCAGDTYSLPYGGEDNGTNLPLKRSLFEVCR